MIAWHSVSPFCFRRRRFLPHHLSDCRRGPSLSKPKQFRPGTSNRALILWMLKPKRIPLSYGPEEYTCPDWTRGSYYSGPTRVSLVDVPAGKIINTIDIKEEPNDDTFDIPYKVRALIIRCRVLSKAEGKPADSRLKDYNGDGQALEFALFRCGCLYGITDSADWL